MAVVWRRGNLHFNAHVVRRARVFFLHEMLSQVAHRVVVAHAGQLRLIFRGKKKNDRADAEKLA